MFFRHESCIRRGCRHEPALNRLPHSPRGLTSTRRVSRLAEPGRTCSVRVDLDGSRRWRLVGLPLVQHPVACFGEMAGNGDDGASVSLAWSESVIEQTDVAVAVSLEPYRAELKGT